MRYRTLGRTGVQVSPICLGTMIFGDPVSATDGHLLLDAALDAGINFIDTANVYTAQRSEQIIGDWLARDRGHRHRIVLATKVHHAVGPGPNAHGNHRLAVLNQVEGSLRRLRTDHIDVYYFHRPDPSTPLDEQIAVMQDLITQGKVRYFGTSHFPAWMIAMGLRGTGKGPTWSVEQPYYSLLDRAVEQDIVPFAQAVGHALVPHSPLAGGFLTGKYQRRCAAPVDSRATRRRGWIEGLQDADWDVLTCLCEQARLLNCDPSQLAIAWLLDRPCVASVAIGPRTIDQLQSYVAAADLVVPPASAKVLSDTSLFAAQKPLAT